ncbi:MAG: response regulator [Ignavibacteriae bacterium]|nr:response regulator [Ignavibacteriota bacterium]
MKTIKQEEIKPKVLIVDDERGLRTGTKRILQSEGYDVDTAENGTEGIELGTKNDYDLAIIDLKMPDIDGIEVLKTIKKAIPNTICYIATAFASFDTAIEATKLGAQSYIPKPFTTDELLKHLEAGYEKRLLILESERLRKEREERLLEIAYEKSRLNTIVSSIVDGVMVVNKTGELVLFNPASLKYFDLNEIIIGENILGILPKEISVLINKILTSEKYENKSYSTQVELKPNRELYVEITCSPVPHPDGSLAGVVTIINNITELKKVEYIKNQFVSMVAHELKAPMAAVMGFMNLILDESMGIKPEKQKEYISRSSKRLQGLIEMVNDLLDISRMEIKKKEREISELNVSEILKSNIDFLELELKKKGITVTTNIEPDLPPIKADNNEINRLFTNILSNALKYNKENGKIDISVYKSGTYIVSKIADTGIGMKPEDKAKLFQEFFRVKNDQTRNIPGTGLGLSIVKRIVESYSGKIEVQSEYGAGTTFIIKFPYKV